MRYELVADIWERFHAGVGGVSFDAVLDEEDAAARELDESSRRHSSSSVTFVVGVCVNIRLEPACWTV